MKKLGLMATPVVVLLVVAAGLWMGAEFTECQGTFSSGAAAERAADSARDADLEADVDHRTQGSIVTFSTGETGKDAREQRRAFRRIVKDERGELGHAGGGCTERPHFD